VEAVLQEVSDLSNPQPAPEDNDDAAATDEQDLETIISISSSASGDQENQDKVTVVETVDESIFVALSQHAASAADGTDTTRPQSTIEVELTTIDQFLDLSDLAPLVVLTGIGSLQLINVSDAVPLNLLAVEGTEFNLKVNFAGHAYSHSAAPSDVGILPSVSLELEGNTSGTVDLDFEGAEGSLIVDSGGTSGNSLSVNDIPDAAKLQITILGNQELTLKQRIENHEKTHIDASELSGSFLYAVDLGSHSFGEGAVLFDGSNFEVNDNANVALMNIVDGTHVTVGTNLQKILLFTDGKQDSGDVGIELNLIQYEGSQIGVVSAPGIGEVAVSTTGGSNSINVLDASALSKIVLSGAGSLAIGHITAAEGTEGNDIVIDATGLSGSLSLNLTGLATSDGRDISVLSGDGNDVITFAGDTGNIVLDGGGGANEFHLTGSSGTITINDLAVGDRIVLGAGSEKSAFYNIADAGQETQLQLDTQVTVKAAALAAASPLSLDEGAQTVLFKYHGETYAYVDASGDHIFQNDHDLIVKLTGTIAHDLSSVFHVG
jgi:hypothetical protein